MRRLLNSLGNPIAKPSVFLTGGDGIGWAIDEDMALTRRALDGLVEFTDFDHCQVVHSMWWFGLTSIPGEKLAGKRIICHIPAEPLRYLGLPEYRNIPSLIGCWIARSRQAARQLAVLGCTHRLIPYTVDVNVFHPLPADNVEIRALCREWDIPRDRYLIGSFQRDTEGNDLRSPKLVKGPDVFAQVLAGLHQRQLPLHVILAGPRRHWVRRQLASLGIPYTFVGQPIDDDDLSINTLPRDVLNMLYNLISVYVVTSRSEGGPQAILEAAAAQCKIVSTPVGLAEDVLEAQCIYRSPVEAVDRIAQDVRDNCLAATLPVHQARILAHHLPETNAPLFRELYARLETIPTYPGPAKATHGPRPVQERSQLRVGIWHRFFKPPYGGGNQFMTALSEAMRQRGVDVIQNELNPTIDVYLLNSIHFDVERFLELSQRCTVRVVHRIDGPIHLIRGFDREKDELCFSLNARLAAATVLQSAWTLQRIVEMGYQPVNPVIIHNAVDPTIFHRRGRIAFDRRRKIRLISTSWSDNPRKGGATYKWLEQNLDWDRFEYTFVGRLSEPLERAHHIQPIPSEELADLLRQHDIYITASRNDPCSNALIEALACGLPAVYLNDGGHPELVSYGGLPFSDQQEIPALLERLADNYQTFQNLIVTPDLDTVAGKYLMLLQETARA